MTTEPSVQGRRIQPRDGPRGGGYLWLKEGDYGQLPDGTWAARPPGCTTAVMMGPHEVEEHDGGTITVPYIYVDSWPITIVGPDHVVSHASVGWSGALRRGDWIGEIP